MTKGGRNTGRSVQSKQTSAVPLGPTHPYSSLHGQAAAHARRPTQQKPEHCEQTLAKFSLWLKARCHTAHPLRGSLRGCACGAGRAMQHSGEKNKASNCKMVARQ